MLPVVILAIEDESDRAFMTQIYLDHERIMYAEMLKMSDNRGIMDDVFQESLIRLIDKIDVLRRLDERKRVNYIITTVRNQMRNYRRDHKAACNIKCERTNTTSNDGYAFYRIYFFTINRAKTQ